MRIQRARQKKRATERERKRASFLRENVRTRGIWRSPMIDTPEIRGFEEYPRCNKRREGSASEIRRDASGIRSTVRSTPSTKSVTRKGLQDTRVHSRYSNSARACPRMGGRDPCRNHPASSARDANSGETSGRGGLGHVTWGTRQGTRPVKTPPRSSVSHKENGVL